MPPLPLHWVDRLERLKHKNPILSLSPHYPYPHQYSLPRRQIARPDVAVDLPEALVVLPDGDIFAHIKQPVACIQETIGADLVSGMGSGERD